MEYETVIGLEVHAQLLTKSKMFCACPSDYAAAPPNTHVCPVCLGLPGVLPRINRQAVEYTIMTGLALGCSIAEVTRFDRKNYHYPDLMKGYQISQYDQPISSNGYLMVEADGREHRVGIARVHQEEDTAKLVHRSTPWGETYSLVDVNRSGVPLMEIVSEPDLRSPEQARQYLMKLRAILQYLGVSTGNMEEGSFRCDANISLRPLGTTELLGKVEVKNMNSFRAVYRALAYEVERQRQVLESGGRIEQETRGWVDDRGVTASQRSKEFAHDYRYFPEPDLPPLAISRAWVDEIRARLPELPEARKARFEAQYGLTAYEADLLTTQKAMADFFEEAFRIWHRPPPAQTSIPDTLPFDDALQRQHAKTVANWMLGDISRLLNAAGLEIQQSRLTPAALAALLDLLEEGSLGGPAAKTVLEEMFQSGRAPQEIMAERGLTQISDTQAILEVVDQVLVSNTAAAADFRSGKEAALRFLVGQVMRQTRGRANPTLVNELLIKKLTE